MEHMSREDLYLILKTRSSDDPTFRDRLVADPHSVLEEIVGYPLPESLNITVHEESLTDIHLVLEPIRGEVSEKDLTLVAGGYEWGGSCAGCSL